MATHDYDIANGTGAAVRADLNNALAAIVSNNSSASAPTSTFAYMWWADTTDNVLKMRNSANNGWITLQQLDGTMLLEDGSAGSPAIAFRDDTNTGMFSGAADELNFSTGGAERFKLKTGEVVVNDPSNDVDFRVEGNNHTHLLFANAGTDHVGIKTNNPKVELDVARLGSAWTGPDPIVGSAVFIHNGNNSTTSPAHLQFGSGSSTISSILFGDESDMDVGSITYSHTDNSLRVTTNASEQFRVDSDGRFLLGGTSALGTANISAYHQIRGTGANTSALSLIRSTQSTAGPTVIFAKSRGTDFNTAVQSSDVLGTLTFCGSDGTDRDSVGGQIRCEVDTVPGSNDMPGRITFRTTADGAASATERMRINRNGHLGVGTTSPDSVLHTNGSRNYTGTSPTFSSFDVNFQSNTAALAIGSYDGIPALQGHGTGTAFGICLCPANGKVTVGAPTGDGDLEIRGISGTISRSSSTQSTDTNKAFRARNNSSTDTFYVSYRGKSYLGGPVRILQDSTEVPGNGNTTVGAAFQNLGADGTAFHVSRSGNLVALFNRNQDGTIVQFNSAGNAEGDISISGSTTSYNGAHLSRWSQLAANAERTEILRGSVLSNLDEMCEWAHAAQDEVLWTAEDELPEGVSVGDVKTPARDAYTELNEQLNRMKVSDVEGDRNVAGVFQAWDDDDDTFVNDFYCAVTGDFVIRIAQGTTVARGDLLMSAGDGTAKPQDDDIVRSKTVAKVTSTTVSTTYADGSYCVPCVLMAC